MVTDSRMECNTRTGERTGNIVHDKAGIVVNQCNSHKALRIPSEMHLLTNYLTSGRICPQTQTWVIEQNPPGQRIQSWKGTEKAGLAPTKTGA
eukprot:1141288-Pelagomonas_calceolata.AAC.4